MGERNRVKQLFAEDPGNAIAFVRENLGGRQRRVVTLLDGLLEETDRLIAQDADQAVLVSETVLGVTSAATSTRWIRARAFGVLASAYGMVRRSQEAMRLLAQGWEIGRDTFEAGALLMRKSVIQLHLKCWREALRTANKGVRHFERTEVPRETEFCSLAMALSVRAGVAIDAFSHVPGIRVSLSKVIDDCNRCLELVGRRKEFRSIALYSLLSKNQAISNLGLAGVKVAVGRLRKALDQVQETKDQLRRLGLSRRSVHWAYCLWLEAQLRAQIEGVLTVEAERLLRSSRHRLMELRLVDEAVALTLEYQWWLMRSGRGRQAAQEAEFLDENADKLGPLEQVVRQWIAAIRSRRIAEELNMVFQHVRGVRNVQPPNPVAHRQLPGW